MTFSSAISIALVAPDYHSLAMTLRPICEPVELPADISLLAERVKISAGAEGIGDFVHFHDVAELVLFKQVSGTFIANGDQHIIDDGSIVFVPSMRHHDFKFEPCEMEWVLVQFDPDLIDALGAVSSSFRSPFCMTPDGEAQARIGILGDWLVEAVGRSDPNIERIAQLLLLAIAEAKPEPAHAGQTSSPVERLLPALEMLRTAPARPIALASAATACCVSPAYFSRRFRQLFGMTFTLYARTYRLRLAARRLAASGMPISEIAYGVGFSNPAHFTARFRERFGMTPSRYRASARLRDAG